MKLYFRVVSRFGFALFSVKGFHRETTRNITPASLSTSKSESRRAKLRQTRISFKVYNKNIIILNYKEVYKTPPTKTRVFYIVSYFFIQLTLLLYLFRRLIPMAQIEDSLPQQDRNKKCSQPPFHLLLFHS